MPQPTASPNAKALIRATLERILERAPVLVADLHDAVAANAPQALIDDPALAAEIEQSNATIFATWLVANIQNPGEPVEPVLNADTLDIVRDVARRGLEDLTENYFRVGLGATSQHVMAQAFELSSDAELLREALSTMLGSASEYVDKTVAALRAFIAQERALRAADGPTHRLDVATALIEGDETDTLRASARLGFELGRPLVACILWTAPASELDTDALTQAARQLAGAAQATSSLVIPSSATSVWAWFVTAQPVDSTSLRATITTHPGLRVAIGSVGSGAEGFRRSHLHASQTQRVMHRLGPAVELATYREIRTVQLAGTDELAAAEFVAATLGALATAPRELRATLRCLIASGFDTVAVAEQLDVHRNTVLARQRRAQALLPHAPNGHWIETGLALELDAWHNHTNA